MEKNMFGLDEYTYNLIINYFKTKPSIKIVRAYGSRFLGNSRKTSDIDLMIEGTFPEFMLDVFMTEINALKHPYRIDLVPVTSRDTTDPTFVARNFADSDYFYKAKDFYPQDKYVEKGCEELILSTNNQSWEYRFLGNFLRRYNEFSALLDDYQIQEDNDIEDLRFQIMLFEKFKGFFEGTWKTLKHYYKENGVRLLFPRQILKRACDDKILSDFKVWDDMIYDFNIMTDEKFANISDELFYRLRTFYMPAMFELKTFFENKRVLSI